MGFDFDFDFGFDFCGIKNGNSGNGHKGKLPDSETMYREFDRNRTVY